MFEGQVGDIRTEHSMRDILHKFPVKHIIKCPMLKGFLHNHFVGVYASNFGKEMILVHDPTNLLVIHDDSFI